MAQSTIGSTIALNFFTNQGDGRTITRYRSKQKIFSQGDVADSVLFVQKGRVKVTVASEGSKEVVVAILGKGELCGEACLSGQARRMASARAMTDCEVTRIEKGVLVRALREEPSLSVLFLRLVLRRAIRLEADLVDQLSNSSEKRLARALLMLGNENSPESAIARISQATLAEMIGTTRSRVSFFMNKFRKMGCISYKGKMQIHSALLSAVLNGTSSRIRANIDADGSI